MFDTFLMASTCSISMQSLGKIVLRVPAVGAKMWCLFLNFYRQFAALRHAAGILGGPTKVKPTYIFVSKIE